MVVLYLQVASSKFSPQYVEYLLFEWLTELPLLRPGNFAGPSTLFRLANDKSVS
jgi:hypothetical protein